MPKDDCQILHISKNPHQPRRQGNAHDEVVISGGGMGAFDDADYLDKVIEEDRRKWEEMNGKKVKGKRRLVVVLVIFFLSFLTFILQRCNYHDQATQQQQPTNIFLCIQRADFKKAPPFRPTSPIKTKFSSRFSKRPKGYPP